MFRLKRKPRRSPRITTLTHLFHGIEVLPGSRPCPSVNALAGQRLLSEDAPRLPLPGCEHPAECTCKYKHFVDRRTDARRESDEGLPARAYHKADKRQGSGRRITDH